MTPEEFEHAVATIEAERKRIREEADKKDCALVAELHALAFTHFDVAIGDIVVSRGAKYEVRGVYRVWLDDVWLNGAKLKKDGTPGAAVTTICNWSKP